MPASGAIDFPAHFRERFPGERTFDSKVDSPSEGGSTRPMDLKQTPSGRPDRPKLSVVVCAYNEEQNLPHFLTAVLRSEGPSFDLLEVVCVASGCTDRTVEILREWQKLDSRIRVVVQRERLGKAAALSAGMALARGAIILIENADTVPARGTLEALCAPFASSEVRLVCSRPVPTPGGDSITSSFARLLWELHDRVSRISPKAGEAFALRWTLIPIPSDIEDDDTFVGIFVASQGGTSVYASDAVVFNRVPASPGEFIRQRFRVNRQAFGLWRRTGMQTSTWKLSLMLPALGSYLKARPRDFPRLALLTIAEVAVRTLALIGASFARVPLRQWPPIDSTKWAIDPVVLHGPYNR